MDIKRFIENFADLFDETDPTTISAATKFKELEEWSSLVALSVIAMVDEEYDVTLKGAEMKAANTIAELFEIVKSKQ